MNRSLSTILLATSLLAAARRGSAQSLYAADSLIQRGAIQQGESLYYAAVRVHPRDPQARLALGRYLASRGAVRVGVTLVEEAVQFGLDRSTAAPVLAPMYGELEEYPELLSLPSSALSPAERERARWLVAHPSRTIAADSIVMMSYVPRSETAPAAPVGTVTLRVNGRPLVMALRTGGHGISISETAAKYAQVHRFPANAARSLVAAADSIGLSRVTMTNFPVTVESQPLGVDGSISLSTLSRFSPSFDPLASRVMLHVGNARPDSSGVRLALMDSGGDLEINQAGGWAPLRLPQVATMLTQRRWTLDLRHGQILVE
ncbi:MAG TPA: hypothetical protein VH277_06740 [Gemmatimonadaceae bacterium]|jgi:hypothetical protein|nr:hypothetical protein [Gemmatimonadaceae bacterium]